MHLIFDGNYLFYKTLSVIRSRNEDPSMLNALDTEEKCKQFINKVTIDMCSTIKKFKDYGKIIIVFDSPSWRKQFYSEYKANREKNKEDEGAWDMFYFLMDHWTKKIKKKGIIVSKVEGMEGDDLLYMYSRAFAKKKEFSCIITGDKDMIQCVDEFVYLFNNNSTTLEMYHLGEEFKHFLYFEDKKTKFTSVDPKVYKIRKILIGDSGDNVPNLKRGLGEGTANKIIEHFFKTSQEFYGLASGKLLFQSCEKFFKITNAEFDEAFRRNNSLVNLDEMIYDINQIQLIKDEINDKISNWEGLKCSMDFKEILGFKQLIK